MIPVWSQCITLVLAVGLLSLVGAVILRVAMKMVEQRKVTLSESFVVAFVTALPTFVSLILVQAFNKSDPSRPLVGFITLAILAVGFLIQATAVRWRFQVAFVRASLVSLLSCAFGLGVAFIGLLLALKFLPRAPGY